MDAKQHAPAEATFLLNDKLFIENTLLRVAGSLFCHDPKRAASRTGEIILHGGSDGKTIIIRPDPKLGQPGQLAHKVLVALIKKHSDYGRPVQKEISFTRRELGRLIGREKWGGGSSEQLSRALYEIHHTFITAYFKNSNGRLIEHSFTIFPEILIERRNDWLGEPDGAGLDRIAGEFATLQEEHFTCLNHTLMLRLGTIGQALYMRLFFHFANLYDGRHAARLVFLKRYDAICAEWLGGLTVHEHKSRIIDKQLGSHLAQLIEAGFLTSYSVERAKNGEGFVISFRPGAAFFADYERFYRRRKQGELQWAFEGDRRQIAEPLKVAQLFAEKRSGQVGTGVSFVSSKEVETAKQLLATISLTEMATFFDYALSEAQKTSFDVQSLEGLKQYLPGYLTRKEQRAARKAREAAYHLHAQEAAKRDAYQAAKRTQAADLFRKLPHAGQTAIEAEALAYAAGFPPGSLRERMFEAGKVKFMIEKYGTELLTFEHWQAIYKAA